MIDDPQLRSLVTTALVGALLLCTLNVVVHRRQAISAVSNGLHIVMILAMLDMVWPSAMLVPPTGAVLVFAMCAAWYLIVTLRGGYRPMTGGYHVAMMAAMSWMYVVMSENLIPRKPGAMSAAMTAAEPSALASAPHGAAHGVSADMPMGTADGVPAWAMVVNWTCVGVFAAAAVWWIVRSAHTLRRGMTSVMHRSSGPTSQVLMAAAMSATFAVTV
jgi:hypothetical protein